VNSGTGTISSDSSMNGISIFSNKNANQYDNHNQEAWTCNCFGDAWILTGGHSNQSIPISSYHQIKELNFYLLGLAGCSPTIFWGQHLSSTFFSYSLSDLNPVPINIPFLLKKMMQNELIPFWHIDIQLLQEASAYCYIIILLLDIRTTYIGQAFSLVNGLYQHNWGISRLWMYYNQMELGWFGSDLHYMRAGTFSLG
jgi:hypothetical protein